jgi:hypothetical protein
VVGAPTFNEGQPNEGKVFVYLGSSEGLSTTPAWSSDGGIVNGRFGRSVASAGDVDGDGDDDIIVGARNLGAGDNGVAVVLARSQGSGTNGEEIEFQTIWSATGGSPTSRFGELVGHAGDVNGDGFADVFVVDPSAGIFVFHGSSAGVSIEPTIVPNGEVAARIDAASNAGDVNGDGFGDLAVSAGDRAYVFLGSATGVRTPAAWSFNEEQTPIPGQNLSFVLPRVSGVGDVDGDGYSDVIVVGACVDLLAGGGIALFRGGATGVEAAPSSVTNLPGDCDGTAPPFGTEIGVTSSDLNGDGYADVLVSANVSPIFDELPFLPSVFVDLGGDPTLNFEPALSEQVESTTLVAGAGDTNGDGLGDIAVGLSLESLGQPGEGTVRLFLGTNALPHETDVDPFPANRLAANFVGDVNGDGFSDMFGRVPGGFTPTGLFLGSPSRSVPTGPDQEIPISADGYGDVNGDGFVDLIDAQDQRLEIHFGGSNGADPQASQSIPSSVVTASSTLGTGGDFNGDGLADVLIDSSEDVRLHLGSSSGLTPEVAWEYGSTAGDPCTELHATSARDVNGDGFDDVLVVNRDVGGSGCPPSSGTAAVFLGSDRGVSTTASWSVEGILNAASAGDHDGDGRGDVAVLSAVTASSQEPDRQLSVFVGSAAGLDLVPSGESLGYSRDNFGLNTWSCGDTNGDGLSDLAVGLPELGGGPEANGGVDVVRGSRGAAAADTLRFIGARGDHLGAGVSEIGDVNGDGFSDLLLPDTGSRALVFGNGSAGLPRAPLQTGVIDGRSIAARGHSDAADRFGLSMLARSALGRTRVSMEWQVIELPLTDSPRLVFGSTPPVDSGPPNLPTTGVSTIVTGLNASTNYGWRVRSRSADPRFPHSPWVRLPGMTFQEPSIRTLGPPLQPMFQLVAPAVKQLVSTDATPYRFTWNAGPHARFRIEWSRNLEFQSPRLVIDEIHAEANTAYQTIAPSASTWLEILRLGVGPDLFRPTPIFWRVVPLDGPTVALDDLEVRTLKLNPVFAPVVLEPANDTELPPSEQPRIVWTDAHNSNFRVIFSETPSLSGTRILAFEGQAPAGVTVQLDKWNQILSLAETTEDGVVYFVVFGEDALGRIAWSRPSRIRVIGAGTDTQGETRPMRRSRPSAPRRTRPPLR